MAEGLIRGNPTAEKSLRKVAQSDDEQADERDAEIWSTSHIKTFIGFCRDHDDYLLWRMYSLTGCRRGEALGLHWQDINFNSGEWTIRRSLVEVNGALVLGKPKTRRGFRKVSLDAETLRLLGELRTQQARQLGTVQGGYVFRSGKAESLHPTVISRRFQNLIKWSGLPRIRLHDLRHSVISALIMDGTPVKTVSEMVGHSSTSFTMDRYSHLLPSDRKATSERLARLIEEG